MAAIAAALISDQTDFSYFKPTSSPDTSYQVSDNWPLDS